MDVLHDPRDVDSPGDPYLMLVKRGAKEDMKIGCASRIDPAQIVLGTPLLVVKGAVSGDEVFEAVAVGRVERMSGLLPGGATCAPNWDIPCFTPLEHCTAGMCNAGGLAVWLGSV